MKEREGVAGDLIDKHYMEYVALYYNQQENHDVGRKSYVRRGDQGGDATHPMRW